MLNRNVHVPKLNGADNGKAYVYFVWDYFVGALCRYAHYRWFMRGIHEEVAQYDFFLYFQQQMIFFYFTQHQHKLFSSCQTKNRTSHSHPSYSSKVATLTHRRAIAFHLSSARVIILTTGAAPRNLYMMLYLLDLNMRARRAVASPLRFCLYGYVCAHCRRSPRVWWVWAPLFQLTTPDGRLSCDVFLCSGSSANFVHQTTRRWFNQFESIRKSFAMRQVVWAALVVVANLVYLMFVYLKNACYVWFESFWGAPD